jgi:diguanylate cyclase (GGDEF)-like protein
MVWFRQWRGISAATVVLLYGAGTLIASLLLSSVLVVRDTERTLKRIESETRSLAVRLDQELARRAFVVDAMAAQAELLLTMPTAVLPDAVSLLHSHSSPERPSADGFELALPPGASNRQWGNLTGEGGIPVKGSPRAREMAMALALSPAFAAAASQLTEQPWAYYVSRDRFLYLYPRVAPEEASWSPALAAEHFSLRGVPVVEFERRIYWSKIYRDFAGKGLLATASRPVFEGQADIGTVNVDIRMQTLLDTIKDAAVPLSSVQLLDADGAEMDLGPVGATTGSRVPASGGPTWGEGISIPLQSAWTLRVLPDRDAVLRDAFEHAMVYVAFLVLILAGVLLAMWLRRTLAQVEALSVRDALTGVYNRRHFDDVANVEVGRARRGTIRVGLALIDVDHFKAYNDHYGHSGGDEALRAVARALQAALRRAGDQIFRIGGEEFAILADVQTPAQMEILSQRLCEAVRGLDLRHEASSSGRVTISVGFTVITADDWVDRDTAFRRADAALYQAKAAGRDCIRTG